MRKMFFNLIRISLPLFVIWVFMLAMSNNFDLHDVRINLYASVKRFELITSGDFQQYINDVVSFFGNINFDFNFNYVQVSDIASFFQNIGIWFNGVWNLIATFFELIGSTIKTIGLGIALVGRIILNIFTFVFNPVKL